ncbi:MAG: inorganic phosphate transporter [Rikenellaceae bacterium]|jgi:phosphate/sulfate permease|nr:inorganic phosphate transporter [Rikenellaceae bacterium]
MDPIFTIIVIVLLALAVSDLIVGVSNDAANFLNSAIGSKAAPRWVIMAVASVGIVIGSVFSSGMMEVARNGVFHPGMFSFQDIMMLFLAVMLTDVILLDLFNTLGLPTSTTVSLVFELLGAAVIVALFVIARGEGSTDLSQDINSGKALAIISGILLSVVIAFVCGSIIMYITRLIFSFHYQQSFRIFGPFWCGFAFTAITYFALFKGLKGSSIMTPELAELLQGNMTMLLVAMFLGWTLISFALMCLRVNVLKITVLAGTFSLALAFAGNDLVNFIGVSVAGLDSYKLAKASGDVQMMMGDLAKPVVANTWILLTAGLIMAVTLWTSKKARNVSATEINLARRDEGVERFGSTSVSRGIVRFALNVNRNISKGLPKSLQRSINKRFRPLTARERTDASFDLIRATVNLTVASLLIALGTSLKLPLSTTYVTFMVGMGSSLADRAWGRESAVYRITGVLTVISGWFLTALIAFGVAALVATVLMWLEEPGVYIMLAVVVLILFQSARSYRRKSQKEESRDAERVTLANDNIVEALVGEIRTTMKNIVRIYNQTLDGVFKEDRKLLKQMVDEADELHQEAHRRKHELFSALQWLKNNNIETGHYYVQVIDYQNEATKALYHICKPCYKLIDNNHEGFNKEQVNDLRQINNDVSEIYDRIIQMLETSDFSDLDYVMELRDRLFNRISDAVLEQVRRTKKGNTSSKAGALFFEIASETKTMVLQSRNLIKSQKLFVSNVEE